MVYLKQKDYKREKMVLITGTVLIFITAIIGSQFMVIGKVYLEKVKFLETKGYELNGTARAPYMMIVSMVPSTRVRMNTVYGSRPLIAGEPMGRASSRPM